MFPCTHYASEMIFIDMNEVYGYYIGYNMIYGYYVDGIYAEYA